MTSFTLDSNWIQITTPCMLQVVGGARVDVCVNEVPTPSTPHFILSIFDTWEHTDSTVLYVRSNDEQSNITVTYL